MFIPDDHMINLRRDASSFRGRNVWSMMAGELLKELDKGEESLWSRYIRAMPAASALPLNLPALQPPVARLVAARTKRTRRRRGSTSTVAALTTPSRPPTLPLSRPSSLPSALSLSLPCPFARSLALTLPSSCPMTSRAASACVAACTRIGGVSK